MLVFPFLTLEHHTTFKESMINRLSNLINRNRSAAKISQVLCSNIHVLDPLVRLDQGCGFIPPLLTSTVLRWSHRCLKWVKLCFHCFLFLMVLYACWLIGQMIGWGKLNMCHSFVSIRVQSYQRRGERKTIRKENRNMIIDQPGGMEMLP